MRALSLFSGCLGLDLGMELAGIETLACVEKNPHCQQTIRRNRPHTLLFDDVFSPEVRRFTQETHLDVIFGGPPCQAFSTIGKRRFLEDERGKALLGFVELIRIGHPLFFVMENVTGIVSADGRTLVPSLQSLFEQFGYHVTWKILNAADYGTPQLRRRFIMIGKKDEKSALSLTPLPLITLGEAIRDIENSGGDCLAYPKALGEVMKKIPEGGCWKSLSPHDQDNAMGKANRKSGGLTAFYRRLTYAKPSPTLLTSPVQRATTLGHPSQDRPLSVLEYKRIQGFPDDWKIEGPLREKYKQLGNAVPIALAKHIGDTLTKGKEKESDDDYM